MQCIVDYSRPSPVLKITPESAPDSFLLGELAKGGCKMLSCDKSGVGANHIIVGIDEGDTD
jgi:hypothetical protein